MATSAQMENQALSTGQADSPPDRSLMFRWLQANRHKLNDFASNYSQIPNDPVLDPALFDWAGELAANWETIRDEALAIYRHKDAIPPIREISPDHKGIVADDSWRSFFLVGYRNEVPENIARAPRTAELVRKIPNLNSAFFSILAPGAHLSRHRGVAKALITAHLGLVIPTQSHKCRMEVDDQMLHWKPGEWTIFDDTYEHEVWNDSDEARIILLCQVDRPLRAPASWLAAALMAYIRHSPFVSDVKNRMADWEVIFADAEGRGEMNEA